MTIFPPHSLLDLLDLPSPSSCPESLQFLRLVVPGIAVLYVLLQEHGGGAPRSTYVFGLVQAKLLIVQESDQSCSQTGTFFGKGLRDRALNLVRIG